MTFRFIRNFAFSAAVVLTAARASLYAQTPPAAPATPAFEVVSIHLNSNPDPRWRMNFTPDGLSVVDCTLQWILDEAYGLYDDQRWSGGPAWINQKRFDIQAKYDVSQFPHLTPDQRTAMLQSLLADRFKLVVHHQPREFPLYALVVAKGGSKLQESKPEDIHHNGLDGRPVCLVARNETRNGRALLQLKGCTATDLAQILSGRVRLEYGRAVVDQTGLKGRYSLTLQWTPEDAPATPQQDYSGPSFFTAVKEQLGLELKPTKGPLDTIVIDHVEMPSEN